MTAKLAVIAGEEINRRCLLFKCNLPCLTHLDSSILPQRPPQGAPTFTPTARCEKLLFCSQRYLLLLQKKPLPSKKSVVTAPTAKSASACAATPMTTLRTRLSRARCPSPTKSSTKSPPPPPKRTTEMKTFRIRRRTGEVRWNRWGPTLQNGVSMVRMPLDGSRELRHCAMSLGHNWRRRKRGMRDGER